MSNQEKLKEIELDKNVIEINRTHLLKSDFEENKQSINTVLYGTQFSVIANSTI
jgi:hypothetical protein